MSDTPATNSAPLVLTLQLRVPLKDSSFDPHDVFTVGAAIKSALRREGFPGATVDLGQIGVKRPQQDDLDRC